MLTLVSACLCHPHAIVGWRLFCRAAVDGCFRAAEGLQIGRYSLPAPQELNDSGDMDGTMHKVKVYVPEAVAAKEGERVALFPSRYLVYHGGPRRMRFVCEWEALSRCRAARPARAACWS